MSLTLAELGDISKGYASGFDYIGALQDTGLPKAARGAASRFFRRAGQRATKNADNYVRERVKNAGEALKNTTDDYAAHVNEKYVKPTEQAARTTAAQTRESVVDTSRKARNNLVIGGVAGGAALGAGGAGGFFGARAYSNRKRRDGRT